MDELKAVIRSILTSTTSTLTIQQLSKDYRNTIGGPVPYQKFGYNSLEHMMKSLPDVVVVRGSGPYAELIVIQSEKSAHVDQLVNKQRPSVKKKQAWSSNSRRSVSYLTYNRPSSGYTNTNKAPPYVPPYQSSQAPPRMSNKVQPPPTVYKESSSIVTQTSSPYRYTRPTDTVKQQPQPTSSYMAKKSNETLYKPVIPRQTSSQSNQKQLTLPELNHLHSKTSTSQPQNLELNKENLEKLQQKLSLFDASTSNNINVNSSKPETKSKAKDELKPPVENAERLIPYTVKYNLKTLIEKYPEGIWCAEVPTVYKKLFRSELRYEELGFRSLIELCSSLPSIFHYVRPSTGDFKLYYKNRPLPDSAEKKFTVASYQVEGKSPDKTEALPSFDWKDIEYLLPPGIVNLGEEIPREFIPDNMEVNEDIEVGRGEVYDLSKFWLYINNGGLDELMKNLQDFYTHDAEKYHIPKNVITEGLYCVLLFDEEFHRALIITLIDEGSIKVIFIDYGTTSKVSSSDLYFLHESFAKLPAQAIRCRLANIRPLVGGGPWPKEAVHRFRELFSSYRNYTAKIIRIDRKSLVLDIYLWDNNSSVDNIYVNDRLVKEGFAIYTDQVPQKMLKLKKCSVKHLHLFPTFEELEGGLSPSTSELESMQGCGLVLKFIYPQYFLNSTRKSQLKRIDRIEEFFTQYCLESNLNSPAFEELATCSPFNFDLFSKLDDDIRNYYDIDNENKSSVEVLNSSMTNKSEEKINSEHVSNVMEELTKDCLEIFKDISAFSEMNLQDKNQGSSESSVSEYLDEIDDLGSITDDVVNLTDLTLDDMDIEPYSPKTMNQNLEETDQSILYKQPSTNPFINASIAPTDVPLKLDSHNPFLTFLNTEEQYDYSTNNVPTNTEEVDASDAKSSSTSSDSTTYSIIEKVKTLSTTSSDAHSNQVFESVDPESKRVGASYQSAPFNPSGNAQFAQQIPAYPLPPYTCPSSTYLCPPYLNPYFYQYQQFGYPNLNMNQYAQQLSNNYPRPRQFRPTVPLPPGFTHETIGRGNNMNVGFVGPSFQYGTSTLAMNRNMPNIASSGDFYEKYNEELLSKKFGGNKDS